MLMRFICTLLGGHRWGDVYYTSTFPQYEPDSARLKCGRCGIIRVDWYEAHDRKDTS